MTKNTLKNLSPAALALICAFALTACGKNMNLALKGGMKGAGAPTGDIDTAKAKADAAAEAKKKADAEAKKKTGAGTDLTGKKDDGKSKTGDVAKTDYPKLDGTLQPWSVFDLNDPSLPSIFPYLNQVTDKDGKVTRLPLRHIGDQDQESGKNESGFVSRGNLVFRAIRDVPKQDVEEIITFQLELKGLTLHNPKNLDRKTLAKQVLCLMEKRECTGEKASETAEEIANLNNVFWNTANVRSKDFSEVSMGVELKKIAEAIVLSSKDETVIIDLKKAYGLDKMKDVAEQLQWLDNNTTLFIEPNYRKFRFVMANNVYVESGSLNLQFRMKNGKTSDVINPDLKDATHGEKDLQDGSKVVATVADTDKKADPSLTGDLIKNDDAKIDLTKKDDSKKDDTKKDDGTIKTDAADKTGGKTNADTDKDDEVVLIPGPVVTDVAASLDEEDKIALADIKLDLWDAVLKFSLDSDVVAVKDRAKLAATAKVLKAHGINVETTYVTGHADRTTPNGLSAAAKKKYNDDLSLKRAKKVSGYLLKGGIAKSAIKPAGKGAPTAAKSACATANCPGDRKVVVRVSLNKKLKSNDADPVVLQQLRDKIRNELKTIWERNTKII